MDTRGKGQVETLKVSIVEVGFIMQALELLLTQKKGFIRDREKQDVRDLIARIKKEIFHEEG